MAKDLYEALGLTRSASEKEIKAAYRRLARKYHPDVNPNDRAAVARFKEVNAAHEVLSDPEKRKKYDKWGDRWEMADQLEAAHAGRGAGAAFRGNGGEASGDFGSIFDSFFRRERAGPRAQPGNRRGQDVETPVDVSLEEAFHGTTRTVNLQAQEACATCGGSGDVAGAICHTCGGVGVIARPRRLEVRIPAGVKTGSRIRVAGEGRPGTGKGAPGDLYLVATVLSHHRFERKGDDLHTEADVPYLDAILGGEITLQTIDGRIALKIPELTQNGRQIRIGGKGMPLLGQQASRGDLFVRVRVALPESLSPEEREHILALRKLRESATIHH